MKDAINYSIGINGLIVSARNVRINIMTITESLIWAIIKLYDNYKTPLGCPIKCYKSRYCSAYIKWDDDRFIVWMEISNIDTSVSKIGWLIPNDYWDDFKTMIMYANVPDDIQTDENVVIERIMGL